MSIVQPIETIYRGYRFRSRLEARWAVFFHAAGIEWAYEPEGYTVDGRNYLPDFWLPKLKTLVEIKPTDEAAKEIRQTLEKLAEAHGCEHLILVGTPSKDQSYRWSQCVFCDAVGRAWGKWRPCNCEQPLNTAERSARRIEFALQCGQQARFEHGEDGRLPHYVAPRRSERVDVYIGGSVLEDVYEVIEETNPDYAEYVKEGLCDGNRLYVGTKVCKWRRDIGVKTDVDYNRHQCMAGDPIAGRFFYAGPTIEDQHGQACEGLARQCLDEVSEADVLFVWIDTLDTRGTLVEIGAAAGSRKPTFIAFASRQLADKFYFARQLAGIAVVCDDATKAWRLFKQWRDR